MSCVVIISCKEEPIEKVKRKSWKMGCFYVFQALNFLDSFVSWVWKVWSVEDLLENFWRGVQVFYWRSIRADSSKKSRLWSMARLKVFGMQIAEPTRRNPSRLIQSINYWIRQVSRPEGNQSRLSTSVWHPSRLFSIRADSSRVQKESFWVNS